MISEELMKQIRQDAHDWINETHNSKPGYVTVASPTECYIAGATKYIQEFEAESNRIKRINEKYVALKDENSQLKARIAELEERRLTLLVCFGTLIQMKDMPDLTTAAKKFLKDFDEIGAALNTKTK